jgi:site-specific recombinase XerC
METLREFGLIDESSSASCLSENRSLVRAPADPLEAHRHGFKHSVANYILDSDANHWEVRNSLRHQSVLTTVRIYEHFQRR